MKQSTGIALIVFMAAGGFMAADTLQHRAANQSDCQNHPDPNKTNCQSSSHGGGGGAGGGTGGEAAHGVTTGGFGESAGGHAGGGGGE